MADGSDLAERLETFLAGATGEREAVSDLARLPGGASRETWSFRCGPRRLILRRDPPGAAAGTGRADEFQLLQRAARAGVAVPDALWYSDDAFGAPGFVMARVEGETIARKILRDDEFAGARPRMAAQCGELLARVHAIDVEGLHGFAAPSGSPAQAELDRYRAVYDAFADPHPPFELTMRWLVRRLPDTSRITLVHGDFRNGNLIVGPDGVRAVLDWELAHLGDPWEDLAWLCMRSWRFGGDGEVGGFGERKELYKSYERTSGLPVDADAVHWWEVFCNLKWGVQTMVQASAHLSGRLRSVELAAIGRRTCETEYDLLTMLAGR